MLCHILLAFKAARHLAEKLSAPHRNVSRTAEKILAIHTETLSRLHRGAWQVLRLGMAGLRHYQVLPGGRIQSKYATDLQLCKERRMKNSGYCRHYIGTVKSQ